MRQEFTEVLNDLFDYFLLADIRALQDFAQRENLGPALDVAFTTSDAPEEATEEGVLLALPGVDNLPYTVAFVTAPDTPELAKPGARLVHHNEAFALRVDHGSLELFTWPILTDFTEANVKALLEGRPRQFPRVELDKGWYRVDVFAGWLDNGEEPAFEFLLTKAHERPADTNVDLMSRYPLLD